MTVSTIIHNLSRTPDRLRALDNYRQLARDYDVSCRRIEALRLEAVRALQLRSGETVFDIACGTGPVLRLLARAVGASGNVVGVELSPEMAEQASRRAASVATDAPMHVECCAVEDFHPQAKANAMLLSYTHDGRVPPRGVGPQPGAG